MPLETLTLAERPDLEEAFERFAIAGWPRFLRQRDELGSGRHWPSLFTTFAGFQLLLCESGRVAAVGHSVPIAWDGAPDTLPESIAGVLENAMAAARGGTRPTALSALAAITGDNRGRGLSAEILRAMHALARRHDLSTLVAPVRPTLKTRYPLAPMERYVRWRREDGLPLDPWMRVHRRLGAQIVRVIPRALVITGTVAEWEAWTEMALPDSGPYVIDGALRPVTIDRARDEGRYEDPNVWMVHHVN